MRSTRFSFVGTIVAVIAITLLVAGSAFGQGTGTIIQWFNNSNGYDPIGGLIIDASGNLYGSTFYGGIYGAGNIFKLTPRDGAWIETELYSFNSVGTDGFWPNARLAFDSKGNLYGTTFFGGSFAVGIVFELMPNGDGTWTYKTLHNFGGSGDGTYPHGGLTIDAKGNVYGTAAGGGANKDGVVYDLMSNGHGSYTEKILHSFSGADGANPYSSLVLVSGSLYGTTYSGGSSSACTDGCGTVFALTPAGNGNWTETVVHSFNNVDGANPDGGLIRDSSGNLYGAASQGNSGNLGAIFELTPAAGGGWQEETLHTFNQAGDAIYPLAPLTFDASGNLWGATDEGGTSNMGAVFELSPMVGGGWSEKVVYSFANGVNATNHPGPELVFDKAGNLYGGTLSGGDQVCLGGCGGIFQVTP